MSLCAAVSGVPLDVGVAKHVPLENISEAGTEIMDTAVRYKDGTVMARVVLVCSGLPRAVYDVFCVGMRRIGAWWRYSVLACVVLAHVVLL
eukprot:8340287-Heterocapsa_arctica.AAC.1